MTFASATSEEGPLFTNLKTATTATIEVLRAARSHTRRHLNQPRPSIAPEARTRIRQWKAEIKEAAKGRRIGASEQLYAHGLLELSSVRQGHYSLASDRSMGEWFGKSDVSARRWRRRLDKAGLIEVLGHGEDGNSCLVRPILRDGTPVFPDPEMPTRPVTYDHPPRSNLTADLSTKTPKTEGAPPLPPAPPDTAGERGAVFEHQIADPLQAPTVPPGPKKAATEGAIPEPAEVIPPALTGLPGLRSASPFGSSQGSPVEILGPGLSFLEFWVAIGQTGIEGYARSQWAKLTVADKAAIRDWLSRPRSWAADMWAGKWLECRVWEEAVPAPSGRPEQVFIRENTPEWRCWQRHLGRSMPVNSQGGWWFSSRLPPLTDA